MVRALPLDTIGPLVNAVNSGRPPYGVAPNPFVREWPRVASGGE